MKTQNIITQLIAAFVLLITTAFFSWYEGSALLDDPWDWKYSTPISHLLNGSVKGPADISNLDFFVYAAKFHPVFPLIALALLIYILCLACYLFARKSRERVRNTFAVLGVLFIVCAALFSTSSSLGGKLAGAVFLLACLGVLWTTFRSQRLIRKAS